MLMNDVIRMVIDVVISLQLQWHSWYPYEFLQRIENYRQTLPFIHTIYCSIKFYVFMIVMALFSRTERLVVINFLDAEIKRYLKGFLLNFGNLIMVGASKRKPKDLSKRYESTDKQTRKSREYEQNGTRYIVYI